MVHIRCCNDWSITHFLAADLAALFLDDLAALLLADLAGDFLRADLAGFFLVADLAGDFLELLAICLVLLAGLVADGLSADLTGVVTGAEVVTGAGVVAGAFTIGAVGFMALLTGVETFLADCFEADLLVADLNKL